MSNAKDAACKILNAIRDNPGLHDAYERMVHGGPQTAPGTRAGKVPHNLSDAIEDAITEALGPELERLHKIEVAAHEMADAFRAWSGCNDEVDGPMYLAYASKHDALLALLPAREVCGG